MLRVEPVTPAIGAQISGVDFTNPLAPKDCDRIYQALLDHLVIFIRRVDITPAEHLTFASQFGDLDEPHLSYPHVAGFERIMLLENDAATPPDTNSWHTDLTYKSEQPFASVLVARKVPAVGGDTVWSSNYAAYDRLPDGLKRDLENMRAIHDMGDFRNDYVEDKGNHSGAERLNEQLPRFGHNIRPLIDVHPVSGRRFLNFNEAFVAQIAGMTTSDSNALVTLLAHHMNKPEDQIRWRWRDGDLAMWDNRVTMHYAVADYLPHYRCMNRVTIVRDRRVDTGFKAA